MCIVMRSGMTTVISVVFKEIVVSWCVGVMMRIVVDSMLWEIVVHWNMGIMMDSVLWEVVVIMVISMGFPTSSMVIMMGWVVVVMHIVVFSVAIVVVDWRMSMVCIMVVYSMGTKMGINTMWVMDWGVD